MVAGSFADAHCAYLTRSRPKRWRADKVRAVMALGTVRRAAFKRPDKDALQVRSGNLVTAASRCISSGASSRAPRPTTAGVEAVGTGEYV